MLSNEKPWDEKLCGQVKVLITFGLLLELLDLVTDAWMLHMVISEGEAPDLIAPWIASFSVATVVSLASLGNKLLALRRAIQLRREEAGFDDTAGATDLAVKLLKHCKNHKRTSRAINSIYAGVAVAFTECIPLGVLQIVYMQRVDARELIQTISLVVSAAQLGAKVFKVVLLKDLLPYRSKQAKKVKKLEALVPNEAAQRGTQQQMLPKHAASIEMQRLSPPQEQSWAGVQPNLTVSQ